MKTNILIVLFFSLTQFSLAQTVKVKEPEYIGNVVYVNDSIGDGLPLEYQQGTFKTKSNAASYIPGASLFAGKTTAKYYVNGITSTLSINKRENVSFIIRYSSNQMDPQTFVKVLMFVPEKGYRTLEMLTLNSLGNQTQSNSNIIPFKAKKYGESSYIITVASFIPGEYAISTIDGYFYLFSIK